MLDAIVGCRTAALGGHVDVCKACQHRRQAYNSCHDRHCPKCPAIAQAKWIAGRLERVLPTHYFHVVFTLPAELRPLFHQHPAQAYDLLFRCAAQIKIRHFGLMSAAHAKTRLETARRERERSAATVRAQQQALRDALATAPEEPVSPRARWREMVELLTGVDLGACPVCGSRNLEREPLPRAPPATIMGRAA